MAALVVLLATYFGLEAVRLKTQPHRRPWHSR
jgi:hypothetical protein